ncbi:DUF4124 domain-containing protein [Gilvimarinus polysaccharolyticus]|uniref:DUF4124 domain-containing protein n=1 Tax=Gilvimarinus polysaccharolyticus TaxID=863921 RepID=UPI0006738D72|nr:DUF4124 domain-containing protein [Gilvimarinus polysaccharolyticus]
MRFLIFAFLLLMAVGQVSAAIYQWTDENGRVRYSDKPPAGQLIPNPVPEQPSTETHTQPAADITLPRKPSANPKSVAYARPGYSDILMFRRLFIARDFDELNQQLHLRQQEVQADIAFEHTLRSAYYAFRNLLGADTEKVFEQWLAHSPKAYQAYLARAAYQSGLAWGARGSGAGSKLTQYQRREMKRYFEKAKKDIAKALALNPQALMGYYLLLNAALPSHDLPSAKQALARANRHYPNNYLARRSYLALLDPMWGGSIEGVRAFVSELQLDASSNPKLSQLQGFEFFVLGKALYYRSEYEAAIEALDLALKLGPNPSAFYMRGRANYRLGLYRKATDDFTRANHYQPDTAVYLYWRSKSLYYTGGRFSDALVDVERAHALDGLNENIERFRVRLSAKITRSDFTGFDKQQAEIITQSTPSLYDEQALFKATMAHLALDENSEAEQLLIALIKLKPDNFNYFELMDFALFRQARQSEIVDYWDDFIGRNPEHRDAYLERSGTYFHLQDYPAAIRDAKKSAELGNLNAVNFYQRLAAFKRD